MDLVLSLLAIAVATTLAYLLHRIHGAKRLPPGPLGVPLLGSLPFLSPDLHRYFATLAESYGPVTSIRLGTKLWVVITSASAAKQVLHDHDIIFANRDVPILASICTYGGSEVVWAPYGPHWRMVRKLVVRELLSPANINAYRQLRRREVNRAVEEFRSRAGEAVVVRDVLSRVGMNVIMIWDGALDQDVEGSMGKELQESIEGMLGLVGLPNISDFFPALAPFDLQRLQRRMKKHSSRLDAIFNSIVKERNEANKADEGKEGRKHSDFLQVMLDLIEKNDLQVPLKLEHAKGLLVDMISGGTDTSSTTTEWAMTEILRHPEIMAKVQQELDIVVGTEREVKESHIPQLHYLNAVVKETMRLHPVIPLLVPHQPSSSCNISGHTIPKGTSVSINVWAIHRDPCAWEKPKEFMPERFLQGDHKDKGDYNGQNFNFLPFGSGRRICPGIALGERMMMYMLSSLMHSFHWRLPKGMTNIDVDEKFSLMLKKKRPLVIVPIWRLGEN